MKPLPPAPSKMDARADKDVPVSPPSDPPSLDFARLMKDPAGRQTLMQHAQSEHSEENLLFYEGAQRFRGSFVRYGDEELSEDERARMRERAHSLVEQFLTAESDHALNLPSHQLAMYESGLKQDVEIKANMFDAIMRTIYKSIELDTFARFKVTSKARELATAIPRLARRSTDSRSSKQRSSSSLNLPAPRMARTAEEA